MPEQKISPAGADRRRLVMPVVLPEIEPRPGWRDDFAGHLFDPFPETSPRHRRS
jgi:hypothetical protein